MNTIKSVIVGAVVAVVAMLVYSSLPGAKVQANPTDGTIEYKILQMQNEFKRGDLEAQLNELGKAGYQVRASVGVIVILSR